MASPSVVVVVVCWNCRSDIERCLQSLHANTDHPTWRTVVIDNASTDGTREWLSAAAPGRFELVLAESNLGWVGALNLALARYDADYFFFLNPDAFVEPGWLAPLVAALEENPRAGFASPKFRYLDGSIHYAGAYLAPTGGVRVYGHGEPDGPAFESAREVPFAHGQCLVRAAMARAVGAFDEGFGIGYYEEVDYQLRARRKGWLALFVPASVIVHATAQAFKLHPGGFKEELMLRNWLRVLTLHWPVAVLSWRLPLELLRPLRVLRSGSDLGPTLRAWRGWLSMLPEIAARRSALAREGGSIDFAALRRTPLGRGVLFFYEGYIDVQPTVANLAKAMGRAGYDVTVYIAPTWAPVGELGDGVRIEHLRPRPILERIGELGFGRYRVKRVIARVVSREASFALRGAWREVRIRLRDPRRTVYVGVDANGAGAALLSAALLRRSYVFLSLELKAMERLRKTFRGAVARLAYRRASGVTVQGMDRLEVLARELRWKHENVFILPNSPFADEGAARPAAGGNEMRARWGIAPGKRIALQAGMINDATCSPELAKGFRGSPDWALVLHERQKRSPDEPYLAGLREINPRNLCLSLEPVPYDQVDEIFAAADIGLAFYKPSGPNDDNFRLISSSGKLPHYLKHGKPVLVSDLPSLSAVVEEFQCGFIIKDPSDEAEVAAALEQVSRRYAELSRNALRCFAERYDFGKSAATLMRFMNDF